MLAQSFKEWAVICQALALGRQAIILRKGGIAEPRDLFTPDYQRFWLYPTFLHQNEAALKASAHDLFPLAEADRPGPNMVRFRFLAEVPGAYHVADLDRLLQIDHLHLWTEQTVRQRFAYRHEGIYVLPVRIHAAPHAFDLIETPAYAGCHSWTTLDQALPIDGCAPILTDTDFNTVLRTLDTVLNPIAFA